MMVKMRLASSAIPYGKLSKRCENKAISYHAHTRVTFILAFFFRKSGCVSEISVGELFRHFT